MLALRLRLFVAGGALHVAEEVVAVAVVSGERCLRGLSIRREVELAFRDCGAGVFFRKLRGHLLLDRAAHFLDDRIELHRMLELRAQFQRRHLQHLEGLPHLWGHRLAQPHGLRKTVSWSCHCLRQMIPNLRSGSTGNPMIFSYSPV